MVSTVVKTFSLDEESVKIVETKSEELKISQSQWLREVIKKQK